jgi:pSer/pThr/pTyr-binding forkhead associated (FHA) protein
MIICPSCNHEEFIGALFCSECGTKLPYQDLSVPKTAIYEGEAKIPSEPLEPPSPRKSQSKPLPESSVSLKVLDTGAIIPLEGGLEFTLGRVSGNQPILPDLDLTPYSAYESGVSRLHATIKIEKPGISVTDLGSANGTRVNGKKIPPHTPQLLENGDILTMGKFKVQVLVYL